MSDECRKVLYEKSVIAKFFDGPPHRVIHSKFCLFNQVAIKSFYNATLEACKFECRSAGECTHFNFIDGFCYLLAGLADTSDIIIRHDESVFCGFDCQSLNIPICNNLDNHYPLNSETNNGKTDNERYNRKLIDTLLEIISKNQQSKHLLEALNTENKGIPDSNKPSFEMVPFNPLDTPHPLARQSTSFK